MAIYPHAERHRADPSRGGKDSDYRDGYRSGRGDARRGLTAAQQAAAQQHLGGGGKPPSAGGHWDDGSRSGCPLSVLLLPLLPLFLALAWWRGRRGDPPADWPPPHSRRTTPPPRRDLSAAAEHYAREARKARKRAGGFSLGDPVRKRNHKE